MAEEIFHEHKPARCNFVVLMIFAYLPQTVAAQYRSVTPVSM